MSWPGANPQALWIDEKPQNLTVTSYVGPPEKWREGIPTFAQLRRPAIYPGIDLVYYGTAKQMEYDFVVQPGADARRIRLSFSGAQRIALSPLGDLEIVTTTGTLTHRRPRIYQNQREVAGRFRMLTDTVVGFELTGSYNRSQPLVIDPVVNFASFYGGEGDDRLTAAQNSAVAGYTNSIAFPGANVAAMGGYDAFYLSLGFNPRIVYIGGSGDDRAWAVATSELELRSQVETFVVAGETESRDFPVFSRSQLSPSGSTFGTAGFAGGGSDGFLLYVQNQTFRGTSTSFCTLLGGSGRDRVLSVALAGESLFVGGETDSPDLPANGLITQYGGGQDGFVASYNISANSFASRGPLTYWGGAGDDAVRAIVLQAGRVVVAGSTSSDGLRAVRALQSERRGGLDGYVTVSLGIGSQNFVTYASYWGGSGDDVINALVFRNPSSLWLFGNTNSRDLPMQQAVQTQYGGGESDAWWAKLEVPADSTVAAQLRFATYWGGSGRDTLQGAALQNAAILAQGGFTPISTGRDEVLIAGTTDSTNFPLKEPWQTNYGGGPSDAWAGLFSAGSGMLFSTYYGGAEADEGVGIGQDASGQILLAGNSASPTLAGIDASLGYDRAGATDAFVARISAPALSLLFNGQVAQDAMTGATLAPARLPGPVGSTIVLRARSSNPALLTLSFGLSTPGAAEISTVWNGQSSGIYLHGLASEGTADVILSGDGFPERRFPVNLRPLSAQLSLFDQSVGAQPDPNRAILKVGRTAGATLSVVFRALSEDRSLGDAVFYPRPGVTAPPLTFTTGDASVLTVLSPPLRWAGAVIAVANFANISIALRADRAGSTDLTASLGTRPIGVLPVVVETLRFRATGQIVPGFTTTLVVSVDTRRTQNEPPRPITVTSEDPDAALLAPSDRIALPAASLEIADILTTGFSSLNVVAGTSRRPGRLRFQGAGIEDLVVELPVGQAEFTTSFGPAIPAKSVGFVSLRLRSPSLATPGSFVGLFKSEPLVFGLRSENPGIISVEPTLTIPAGPLNPFFPAALRAVADSGETDIVIEGPSGIRSATPDRFSVRIIPAVVSEPIQFDAPESIGKDLQAFASYRTLSGTPAGVTLTSSDPRRLLISPSDTQLGSASLTIPPNSSNTVSLQALSDEGTVTVTLSAAGQTPLTRTVRLAPTVVFWVTASSEIVAAPDTVVRFGYGMEPARGGYATGFGSSATFQSLRPGGMLPLVEIVNSHPEVGVVASTAPYRFTARRPGVTNLDLRVNGVLNSRQRLRVRVAAPQLIMQWFSGPLGRNLSRNTSVIATDGSRAPLTFTSNDPSRVLINGEARVSAMAGETVRIDALADSGFVRVNVESSGYSSAGFDVDLTGSNLLIPNLYSEARAPLDVILPANDLTLNLIVGTASGFGTRQAEPLRPGLPPLQFEVRSSNPAVVASPGMLTMPGDGTLNLPLRALSAGDATIEVIPPPEWTTVDPAARTILVKVRLPSLRVPDFTLMNGFQGSINVEVENPRGNSAPDVPVTIRSLNPEFLLIAPVRENSQGVAAGPGQPSLTLPAGRTLFLAQAFGEGEALLEVTGPGLTTARVRVLLVLLAFRLDQNPVVQVGLSSREVQISVAPALGGNSLAPEARQTYRLDAPPFTLRLESSDPSVATANPPSIVFSPSTPNIAFRLTLLKPGTTNLQVVTPAGVASPPIALTVITPPINMRLPRLIGKDLVASGQLDGDIGPNDEFTVTSADPSRLTLSISPDQPGTRSVTLRRFQSFSLHALAASGTVELVAEGPGYAPSSGEVRLAPSGVILQTNGSLAGQVGGPPLTFSVALVTLDPANQSPIFDGASVRSGFSLPVQIGTSDPTVGTLSPTPVVLTALRNSAVLNFTPLRAGTTTLRVGTPPGYSVPRTAQEFAVSISAPVITTDIVQFGAWLQNPVLLSLSVPAPAGGLLVDVGSSLPGLRILSPRPIQVPQGQTRIELLVVAEAASGEGILAFSAPGFTFARIAVRIVPSGFIFNQSSAFLSAGTQQTISFRPVPLDPVTLAPVSTLSNYRLAAAPASSGSGIPGGDIVILASENAAIARPAPELVGLREGLGVFETRVEGRATGTTTIRLNAPARFTAPRGGATLEVRVQ